MFLLSPPVASSRPSFYQHRAVLVAVKAACRAADAVP
jgi:hypothetical protein